MKSRSIASLVFCVASLAALSATTGCAAKPAPTWSLERSQSSIRTAEAIGADADPQASVHLRLARMQHAQAIQLIDDGNVERAAWVLRRARTDADLASALARENWTRAAAQQAAEQAEASRRSGERAASVAEEVAR